MVKKGKQVNRARAGSRCRQRRVTCPDKFVTHKGPSPALHQLHSPAPVDALQVFLSHLPWQICTPCRQLCKRQELRRIEYKDSSRLCLKELSNCLAMLQCFASTERPWRHATSCCLTLVHQQWNKSSMHWRWQSHTGMNNFLSATAAARGGDTDGRQQPSALFRLTGLPFKDAHAKSRCCQVKQIGGLS